MSAIWGYISCVLNSAKQKVRIEECRCKMKKPYESCKIDRYDDALFENGFFGCGIQYFTDEAINERLPITDSENQFVFSADIVLNAREKLIEKIKNTDFKLKNEITKDSPDGLLAYYAWLIWKEDFVNYIEGLFSIAIYDLKKRTFYLFADQAGLRCINYSVCDGELFFSTLTRPITDVMPEDYFGINEKWIAACEFNATPTMLLFPEITPFDNVFMLSSGSYLKAVCEDDGRWNCQKVNYWRPDTNEHREYSDAQCRQLVQSTFYECVKDALRCNGNVAATISSGLDSSTVAAQASTILKSENKKLYGYTSIPLEGYVNDMDDYCVPDESEGVMALCALHDNIDHEFTRTEGKSSFTELDRFVEMYELPGKMFTNLVWIDDIAHRAVQKGCKVLLNGQYGNFTISAGGIVERFYQEVYAGRFLEAKRQIAEFGRVHGVPRNVLFKELKDSLIKKIEFQLNLDKEFWEIVDTKYIKAELLKKHRIRKAYRRRYLEIGSTKCEPRSKMIKLLFDPVFKATMGLSDTKLSLYHGILLRDPTRDKRIIELCMMLPNMAFAEGGTERRLVREYLKDLLPDRILKDFTHKGVQSADMVMRYRMYGTDALKRKPVPELFDYMDEQCVRELLNEEITEDNCDDITRTVSLNCFLEKFDR